MTLAQFLEKKETLLAIHTGCFTCCDLGAVFGYDRFVMVGYKHWMKNQDYSGVAWLTCEDYESREEEIGIRALLLSFFFEIAESEELYLNWENIPYGPPS